MSIKIPRSLDHGKDIGILHFISIFTDEHGFGPTVREIGSAVGLHSTSTVARHLNRMTQAGVLTSIPGSPRSIHLTDQTKKINENDDGSSLLRCKFRFPNGMFPINVVAMVADVDQKNIIPVEADKIEIIRKADK